jgi:hypothetical protein
MTICSQGVQHRLYVRVGTYTDPQLTVRHDHEAYIRGWCMLLDGVDRGYYINDNPYSMYYNYSRYKSWAAGRDDAWTYLTT